MLTDIEKIAGSVLNDSQVAVLELRIKELEQQIINIEYDEHSPLAFVQAREFRRGALAELRYMLEISKASQEAAHTPSLFGPDGMFLQHEVDGF